MYSAVFYSIFILILFSLFFRFNPDFYSNFINYFHELEIKKIQIIDNNNEEEIAPVIYGFNERIKRGDYFFKEGFLDLAATEYSNALLIKKNTLVYKKLFDIQIIQGDYDKAENNILSAVSLDPTDDDLIIDLVRIKIKKSNFSDAAELLSKIEDGSEKKDYYILVLGVLDSGYIPDTDFLLNLIKSSDLNIKLKSQVILDSINEFNSYKDGKYEHFRLLLAKSLIKSFEFEIAYKILKEVISLRPDYRDAWILLGYSELRMGKADIASISLNEAFELDSTKPETQFYLGLAYEDLGDSFLSKDFFNKALRNGYQPKSQVVQKLAELANKQGDNMVAIEMYREMLILNGNNVRNFYLPIEIALEKLNNQELALEFAKSAENKHPNNAFSYTLLGLTLFKNGDIEGAIKNIQRSVQMDSNIPENFLYAGMILEDSGDLNSALIQYENAYKKNSNGKIGAEAIKKYNEVLNKLKKKK